MDFFTLIGLNACLYFIIYAIILWFNDCDLQLVFAEKFGKKLVELKGKVIWITSATTELGKMMALKAARHRGKLVLSSKSLNDLEKIKVLCLRSNPFIRTNDILLLKFDVEELKEHHCALERVLKHFGTLDIIVLNEDRWEKGAWEETEPHTDRILFHSNIIGVLSMSRAIIRYFNTKQKGKLAVTSSIAGLIGVPYFGGYTGAKHALHGYLNSLRIEKLGENIQATLLCLGSSELSQENFSTEKQVLEEKKEYTRRKKMTAERCAHLCLTAIVNELDEIWMAVFPILPLIYGIKYYPNITKFVLKYLKSRGV